MRPQRTAITGSGIRAMDEDQNAGVPAGAVKETRIFRRKFARAMAADQAEQAVQTSSQFTPMVAPVENLPAPIGQPWDRLPRLQTLQPAPKGRSIPLLGALRKDPASKVFEVLRSRLLHTLRAKGWSRVAVVSPTAGCGTTFTALNLAQSLACIPDTRVVLLDMNTIRPGVAPALGTDQTADQGGFLSETRRVEDYLQKVSDNLAVGLAGAADTPVADLLHAASAKNALERATNLLEPDVVLFDLPAVTESSAFMACLAHVDGVLVISDGTKTTAAQIARIENQMQGQAALLGVVLNKGRAFDAHA